MISKSLRHVLLLIIVLGMVLAGCGDKDKDEEPTQNSNLSPRLREIQESGKLVVGTAITRPFEYYDEDGKLVGFDVDLMNKIADELGVEVEWREIAFADLLTTLSAGDVDVVIAAMYI